MDGAKSFAGYTGMSVRAQRASVRQRPEKALRHSPNTMNFDEIALRVSLGELLLLSFRCGGGSADPLNSSSLKYP